MILQWVGLLLFAGFCVFGLLEIIAVNAAARHQYEKDGTQ